MPDEPTPGEIMRRLDDITQRVAEMLAEVRADRIENAKTYVRYDVYTANRVADQASVVELREDIRAEQTARESYAKRVESLEDKRVQARNFAISTVIALVMVGLTILALIASRGV